MSDQSDSGKIFEQKEETRRQRNRQHARVSRERKQRQFEMLQEENVRLRTAVADLERQVAVNFNEINYLRELYHRSERENLYLRGQLQGSCAAAQVWPNNGTPLPPPPPPPPHSAPPTSATSTPYYHHPQQSQQPPQQNE